MKQRTIRFPACLALSLLFLGCWEPTRHAARWDILDGQEQVRIEIYTVTERDAEEAVDEIRRAIKAVEKSMLSGRDSGALGLLNSGAAERYWPVEDRDLYRCTLLGLDYARASEGAFDPTVGALLNIYEAHAPSKPPKRTLELALERVGWQHVAVADEARSIRFRKSGMHLDLDGVAKGFALDAAARAFTRPGNIAGLLRIGGNFYAWREPPGADSWSVALPDPRFPERPLLNVLLSNRGIAVSGHGPPGQGRRMILDPKTGLPASGDLLAAVAIADSAADADALSTALFVSGSMGGSELLSKMNRVEAVMLVSGEGGSSYLLASVSLQRRLSISPELMEETGGDVRYLLPPASL
jgi:thiamine biosynthesis lipoprotein